MTEQQAKQLEYPFTVNEIEWRVLHTSKDKTKGQVAAYVDSRAIQKRLDTVLGRENWQNNLRTVPGNTNATTSHVCEISIYYADRKEWITKSDGAGSTDIEPIKGGLSNAFKRAASMWGCGRYLYGLTGIWAKLKDGRFIDDSEMPRLNKMYNQFIAKYDEAENRAATSKEVQPTQTPAKNAKAPAAGRFNKAVQPQAQPAAPDACRVTDVKVSKGGSGIQTLLTLQASDGRSMTGYIKGEAPLKSGQYIRDLKIKTRNDPIAGKYHIIESYQMAA